MLFNAVKGLFTFLFILNAITAEAQRDSSRSKWLPHHSKLQFAGSIGFLSVGAGYRTTRDKFHADLYYGFTPESVGGIEIHALTVKATWFLAKNKELRTIQIRPLSAGVLVNYTFGKQYFGFTPANYPYDYYGFPTAFHIGGFIGGQINKQVSTKKLVKRVGLYYELGTIDIEILSYVRNTKALALSDILNLGIGVVTSF